RTPFRPGLGVPTTPLMRMLRNVTVSVAPALMMMPLVPATSVEATCPPPPSMVIDLVMVTAPKPPGSRALISPPAAVFEIAPAKVLQGAVRRRGWGWSPTREPHAGVACAAAGCTAIRRHVAARATTARFILIIGPLSRCGPMQNSRSCGFLLAAVVHVTVLQPVWPGYHRPSIALASTLRWTSDEPP